MREHHEQLTLEIYIAEFVLSVPVPVLWMEWHTRFATTRRRGWADAQRNCPCNRDAFKSEDVALSTLVSQKGVVTYGKEIPGILPGAKKNLWGRAWIAY